MLRTYLKYMPAWQQLLIFLGIAFGVGIVGSLIADLLLQSITGYSAFDMVKVSDSKDPAAAAMPMRNYLVASQVTGVLFMFIVPAYLFAYFADPQPADFLKTENVPSIKFMQLVPFLVIMGVFATSLLGLINQVLPIPSSWLKSEEKYSFFTKVLTSAPTRFDFVVNIIVVAFFAAVAEELFFRGVMQRIIIQFAKNPWVGIIITAFLFSLFHRQFSGFLPRFGLGIILGALYWFSGSLYAPILYHFLHNAFGVYLMSIKPDIANKADSFSIGIWFTISLGLCSCIGIYFVMKYFISISKTNYAETYPPNPDVFDTQY